jgi:Transcriptional regulators
MNKTVQLVNLWGDFESKHPEAEIEDFCRYYISASKEKISSRELFNGFTPPYPHVTLIKLINWIAKLFLTYADSVLSGMKIKNIEEFLLLNAVAVLKDPKKTEAIYFNFQELSTGLNLLSILKCRGYITEYDDPNDKRSKRVELTAEGEEILQTCYTELRKVSEVVFTDVAEDDINLCILLLKDIEIKFSSLWQQHKCKSFDNVYEEITGKKVER